MQPKERGMMREFLAKARWAAAAIAGTLAWLSPGSPGTTAVMSEAGAQEITTVGFGAWAAGGGGWQPA